MGSIPISSSTRSLQLHVHPHCCGLLGGRGEVMAVTGMANETNRLANGYRVPVDEAFLK